MTSPDTSSQGFVRHPAVPFVLPFLVFITLTGAQELMPGGTSWLYPLKVVIVGTVLIGLRRSLPRLSPSRTVASVAVGVVVFTLWILPEGWYPLLGAPDDFDPFSTMDPPLVYGWIALRLLGATVVVGLIEELFWRGFLLRWLISADFRAVPMGAFTWTSFLITSGLFALEHNRWLVGLIAGVAYNLWFYRTKSLYACVVAHAVTNLALGIYVLVSGEWSFW